MTDGSEELSALKNPISWAVVLSIGFLLLLAVLGNVPTCNIELFPNGACPPKWQHIVYARINEVGDTLAGLAGVLAFIWLVATVLLQAHELREQRKALLQQKDETAAMAQAISKQTNFLKDESRERKEIAKRDEMEALLRSAIWLIQSSESQSNFVEWLISSVQTQFGGGQLTSSNNYEFADTIDSWIIVLDGALDRRFSGRDAVFEGRVEFDQVMFEGELDFGRLPEATELLQQALDLRPYLSTSQKIRLDGMGVQRVVDRLREILSTPEDWHYVLGGTA